MTAIGANIQERRLLSGAMIMKIRALSLRKFNGVGFTIRRCLIALTNRLLIALCELIADPVSFTPLQTPVPENGGEAFPLTVISMPVCLSVSFKYVCLNSNPSHYV